MTAWNSGIEEELTPIYTEELLENIISKLKRGDSITPIQIYRTLLDIRELNERKERKTYRVQIRNYCERLNKIVQNKMYM